MNTCTIATKSHFAFSLSTPTFTNQIYQSSFVTPFITTRSYYPPKSPSRKSRIIMSNSIPTAPSQPLYGSEPVILLTNDDGVHPNLSMILQLAQHIVSRGHNVVVCAPGNNNSACSQRITIESHLTLRRHPDYERRYSTLDIPNGLPQSQHGCLHVFSLDEGTPADCVIAAIEPKTGILAQLGYWPRLTLSGVNRGENIGTDVIYSGTFAGARQSAIYGIPAIASSLNLYSIDMTNKAHAEACERAIVKTVDLTIEVMESIKDIPMDLGRLKPERKELKMDKDIIEEFKKAFVRGDIVLNVNVPVAWEKEMFKITRLDSVLYRGVSKVKHIPTGKKGDENETFQLRFRSDNIDYMYTMDSDSRAVKVEKVGSITPASAFPATHSLAVPDQFLERIIEQGLMFWAGQVASEKIIS